MTTKSDTKAKSSEDLKPPKAEQENEIAALEEKIENLQNEIAELKDKNTRLLAEQSNFVNRLSREQDTKISYAISKFAKDILDVADVLQAGLANCKDKDNDYYQGMDMTLDKLLAILKQYGITQIESAGKPFDSHLHEALTTQESNQVDDGTILHVVSEGYLFKDRVLRHAKVIVSKNISKES